MVGVIIIGHGTLAQAMQDAVEHVLGTQQGMESINVMVDDDPAAIQQQLNESIARCDSGDGVIICADMFGGTPCNIALSHLNPDHIEIISGISLPCLITIATVRTTINDPNKIARKGGASGRRYLCLASKMLQQEA
ncbi:MAG: PTS sugar transporter subunit IIA [Mariprofundales bacterium]|nr:PTS sugar transporter subunit IIA [Mariprofundales bacterium]